MSIASYRMATSPTDQNNQNVLAWLGRLQASVQAAGAAGGAGAFKLDSRMAEGAGSDESEEDAHDAGAGEPTERGSVGQPEDDEPLKDGGQAHGRYRLTSSRTSRWRRKARGKRRRRRSPRTTSPRKTMS